MSETLDISTLKNALGELLGVYTNAGSPSVRNDATLFPVFRSATVKAFEYTYALSIDMYGAERKTDEDINFRDMLRIASEYGLVRDIDAWLNHGDRRNASSHGYQESIADRIFAATPALIEDASHLVSAIEQHIAAVP
jgi:nucleotidyltransferase substrate binding protein (TIGR01987 family)